MNRQMSSRDRVYFSCRMHVMLPYAIWLWNSLIRHYALIRIISKQIVILIYIYFKILLILFQFLFLVIISSMCQVETGEGERALAYRALYVVLPLVDLFIGVRICLIFLLLLLPPQLTRVQSQSLQKLATLNREAPCGHF